MVRTKAVPAVRAVFPDGDEIWQDDPASIHRTREAIDACTAFNDRIPHENQAAKCSDIWPIEQVCRFNFLEVFVVYFKLHLKFPWTQPDAYLVCPWHLPNYLTITDLGYPEAEHQEEGSQDKGGAPSCHCCQLAGDGCQQGHAETDDGVNSAHGLHRPWRATGVTPPLQALWVSL